MEKLKFSLYDITLDEYSDNPNIDVDVYYHNYYIGTYTNKRVHSVTELIYEIVQKVNSVIDNSNVRGIFIARDGSYDYAINPKIEDIFKLITEDKLDVDDYIVKPLLVSEKYQPSLGSDKGSKNYGQECIVINC